MKHKLTHLLGLFFSIFLFNSCLFDSFSSTYGSTTTGNAEGYNQTYALASSDARVSNISSSSFDFTPAEGDSAENYEAWVVSVNPKNSSVSLPSGVTSNLVTALASETILNLTTSSSDSSPVRINREPVDVKKEVGDDLLSPSNELNLNLLSSISASDTEKFVILATEDSYGTIKATKVVDRTITTSTSGEKRRLLIYRQSGLPSSRSTSCPYVITESDCKTVADAFLKDGLDNDLYDKLTSMFGDDIGYYNSSSLNAGGDVSSTGIKNYLISDVDTITILYCDIAGVGTPHGSYIGGYFSPSDYHRGNWAESTANQRPIVYIHAYAAGGDKLGEGITTLAHEFQHLIYNQYWSPNLPQFSSVSKNGSWPKIYPNNSSLITEMFSSSAETYTAQFISEAANIEVPGPFQVGTDDDNRGYLDYAGGLGYGSGRGPYLLERLHKGAARYNTWDNTLYDYGKVAAMGQYLMVNYGKNLFSNYNAQSAKLSSSTRPTNDVEIIVRTIRENTDQSSLSFVDFMSNFATAMLMSYDPNQAFPYLYNKKGWFSVNGMNVPSVNLWQYGHDSCKNGGFASSTSAPAVGVAMTKVLSSLTSGTNSISNSFSSGLRTNLVIVKKAKSY